MDSCRAPAQRIQPASGMVSAFQRQTTRTGTKPRIRQAIHRLVNHFLETPPHDEVRSGRPPLTLGATGTGDERVRDAVCGTVSKKGRVLLLETDPCFRDAISDCLIENGYKVVAVANAHQAFSEITAGDFALVLYDTMTPGLSGEMFYHSVRRSDPDLCERFVFMCDDRNDAATNEFIKNISGFVLKKPFDVSDLLGALAVAELRGNIHSVFDCAPPEPDGPRPSPPAVALLRGAFPRPQPSAVAKILAREQVGPAPVQQSEVPPASEAELPAKGGAPAFLLAGLALAVVLVAGLWKPYWNARDRISAAEANHLALEGEWKTVSQDLQNAVAKRSKFEVAQSQLAGISADRAKPSWEPALRSVVTCAGLEIQVREVRAREKFGDEKMWTLLVSGVSTGPTPHVVADRYRADLQRELNRIFQGGVSIRFDRFEDLPHSPSASPGGRQGAFTITATIRFDEATKPESKEGA